jgi:hypothetical protein
VSDELTLEAGFRVRFPVFVIHNATAARGEPVELFEDAVIGPFVPVFSTEETCASAIRDRVLVGRRVVRLTGRGELGAVLARLGGDEPPWVEFDPDTEQEYVYPVSEVLARIPR